MRLGSLLIVVLSLGFALTAQTAPRVTFSKSFKGSVPAFVQIEIYLTGAATFTAREHDNDPPETLQFQVPPALVRTVFADAAATGNFAGKLEAKQQVAFTGTKMLAYDDATQHNSQMFNYTTVSKAAELAALFDRVSNSGMDALTLRRTIQFQQLNTLDVMTRIQSDWDSHDLAATAVLAPVLQKVADDPDLMDAARHRAQKLLAAFAKSGS